MDINENPSDLCTTLNISNDLKLSAINFPKFPKNATIPEELNDYLRDQLKHVKNENESLQQKLSQTDLQLKQSHLKINELSDKVKEYEGYQNNEYISASQLANSKIVELSKKLREKNSEIEVYKSKCSKLENNLAELNKNCESIECTEQQNDDNSDDKNIKDEDKIKKLQDKLSWTTNKWSEEKNQNLQLKNDLKKANKWLQQEIGDKFETLLALNNSNSNWRGRAQIICDLQKKNAELKEKLKLYQDKNIVIEPNHPKPDKKTELLTKENSELKSNYNELKKKFDAAKARCKVLEAECNIMKAKVSSLNENIEIDQQMIATLTAKVNTQTTLLSDDTKQKEQIIKKLQQENKLLKVELTKEKYASENKSKELIQKDDDIQILNKRIRSARPQSSYMNKHETPDQKVISRLEVERLRLLELTDLQNARLSDERNAHLKTQHLLRIERQKGAKLEANLARLQLEQNSSRSHYTIRSVDNKVNTTEQTESNLKDKLELAEENIKALTTRLEIEIHERKNDFQQFSNILKNYNRL